MSQVLNTMKAKLFNTQGSHCLQHIYLLSLFFYDSTFFMHLVSSMCSQPDDCYERNTGELNSGKPSPNRRNCRHNRLYLPVKFYNQKNKHGVEWCNSWATSHAAFGLKKMNTQMIIQESIPSRSGCYIC